MSRHRAHGAVRATAGGHRRRRSHHPRLWSLPSPVGVLLGFALLAVAATGAVWSKSEAPRHHHLVAQTQSLRTEAEQPVSEYVREQRQRMRISRSAARQPSGPDRPLLVRRAGRAAAARAELLQSLEDRAAARSERIHELRQQRAAERARMRWLNRWVAPLTTYDITATFGESSSLWSSVHTGLDLAAAEGNPISAVARGTVTFAGYDGSYGYRVAVSHPDGMVTWYAHMSSITIGVGDQVAAGSTVGAVGASGNVTGPHLHLEARPGGGGPVDPYAVLQQHGVYL